MTTKEYPSNKMKAIPKEIAYVRMQKKFACSGPTRAINQLFLNENLADFHFIFNSNNDNKKKPLKSPLKLPIHKNILSAISPVFHTMFYGSLIEKDEVEIVDASYDAFKEFLQFFYLTDVTLTMEHVPSVMYLGDKYEVGDCLDKCARFLSEHLTGKTVCWAYELAILFKCKELIDRCNMITKFESLVVFHSNYFLECSRETLCHILKLEPLRCRNTDVFDACIAWAKAACQRNGLDKNQPQNIRAQLGDVFYEIPFARFTRDDFFDIISPNIKLFEEKELDEVIQMIASTKFLPTIFIKTISSTEELLPNEIIECSRVIANSFCIKEIETTTFSSNKPLLLHGFVCANVYEYRRESSQYFDVKFPISDIIITTKTFDKVDNSYSSCLLLAGETNLVTHGENRVELPMPIRIDAGTRCEIRLKQEVPPLSCTFATLKSIIRIKPDIEIRFHSDAELDYDNTATGLVTGLLIERLPKTDEG